jgi:uncharacterized protein
MKTREDKIIEFFSTEPDINAVYLFGSELSRTTHMESDVDIAILFHDGYLPDIDRVLDIQDKLTSLLSRETDIVILNNASPIIRMQVFRKGKKLLERDHRAYSRFFVRTINEYDDLKRVRTVIEKKIKRGSIYGRS